MNRIFSVGVFIVFLALSYHVAGALSTGNLLGLKYRGQEVSTVAFLAIALATILGAALGSVYQHLDSTQDEKPWWRAVSEGMRTKRFGMSLLATPLIVFVVFGQLNTQSLDLSLGLFCLQSGFFWDRTLSMLREKGNKIS